jgi:hypothetical protein
LFCSQNRQEEKGQKGIMKIPLWGAEKRRLRGLPTPHAEMVIAAAGDCNRRTRRL